MESQLTQTYKAEGRMVAKTSMASPSGSVPYYPSADAQTYRDLLIFEERLKQNAARLVKRRKKYQTFLVLLCGAIGLFSYYVFVQPSEWQPLHYLNVTVLLITATMLLLFFASGMYSERITAANKFVPQANRSLRSFNMYLNTRAAPRRSIFSYFRQQESAFTLRRTTSVAEDKEAQVNREGSDSTTNANGDGSANKHPTLSVAAARRLHIPTIPPSSNPRGELIFSSKVSNQFREGYERYRAAFERRRAEKMQERRRSGWRGWWIFGGGSESSPKSAPMSMEGGSVIQQPQPKKGSPASSLRGTRSSPRSSRVRPKLNMSTGNVIGGSGSENSSPTTSRASSPNNSPVGTVGKSNRSSITRGRRISAASQESEANAAQQGERRGRDRTPSITAVSDQRLRRGSSGSVSNGRIAISQTLEEPIQLEENKRRSETAPIIEESTNVIDLADAAEADAQLGLLPDPQLVARSADDRTDVEATLREPEV